MNEKYKGIKALRMALGIIIENEDVLEKAKQFYGNEKQFKSSIEELSELIAELCKFDKGGSSKDSLSKEVADVLIQLCVIVENYGIEDYMCDSVILKLKKCSNKIDEFSGNTFYAEQLPEKKRVELAIKTKQVNTSILCQLDGNWCVSTNETFPNFSITEAATLKVQPYALEVWFKEQLLASTEVNCNDAYIIKATELEKWCDNPTFSVFVSENNDIFNGKWFSAHESI